jgi:hypothetical protein
MTYSRLHVKQNVNFPRKMIAISESYMPKQVIDNIPNISDCHLYFSIASWDQSWQYFAFNRTTNKICCVSLHDVVH